MRTPAQIPLDRQNVLLQFIQDARQHVHTGATVERQETIKSLLTCLDAFGEKHVNFFSGLYRSNFATKLSAIHPKEHVINVSLEQIGFDLDVILRAYSQRLLDIQSHTDADEPVPNLRMADFWSYYALKPVMRGLASDANVLIDEATVLTYYQKSLNVRLIPYAPIVLIGIPFSAVGNAFDLMSIPHEAGHYVYHHGCWENQPIAKWLAQQLEQKKVAKWVHAWAEEIFADVYGCLLAGQHIALSAQDLQQHLSTEAFFEDDGEHPTPAVRPLVYINVLERLGGAYAQQAAGLRASWEEVLQRRRPPSLLTINTPYLAGHRHQQLSSAKIEQALFAVIDAVVALGPIQRLLTGQANYDSELWGRVGQLEAVTEKMWQNKGEGMIPEITVADDQVYLKTRDRGLVPHKPLGVTRWDALRVALQNELQTIQSPSETLESAFNAAFNFGGWAVKGPVGRGH